MLYDGQCPLCSREVALLRKRNARGLIAFEDISLPEFDAGQYGLTMAQVVGAMHAIRPDGSIVRGVDVFAEVYDAVGWKWLARSIRSPATRPLAKLGYRIFATVRPWLSKFKPTECTTACRQPPSRRVASIAFLIFSAACIGGCSQVTKMANKGGYNMTVNGFEYTFTAAGVEFSHLSHLSRLPSP